MKFSTPLLTCAVVHGLMFSGSVHAESPAPGLQPLMAVADQVVLQDDFSTAGPVNKKQWGAKQGTQWIVEEGVLRGRPSTPEYQASRKDHFGYEARIASPITPTPFIARFSVRFSGGSETAIAPFIEFGHHVCRLRLSGKGAELLADHESALIAEAKDFHYEPGKWYHLLAEMKGDEIVIQIDGGPTLHGQHASLAKEAESGSRGLGVAGPKGGTAELDNVTFWSVKPDTLPTWVAKREALPKFDPVPVVKASAKAKK